MIWNQPPIELERAAVHCPLVAHLVDEHVATANRQHSIGVAQVSERPTVTIAEVGRYRPDRCVPHDEVALSVHRDANQPMRLRARPVGPARGERETIEIERGPRRVEELDVFAVAVTPIRIRVHFCNDQVARGEVLARARLDNRLPPAPHERQSARAPARPTPNTCHLDLPSLWFRGLSDSASRGFVLSTIRRLGSRPLATAAWRARPARVP